jgi:hypothetical protein
VPYPFPEIVQIAPSSGRSEAEVDRKRANYVTDLQSQKYRARYRNHTLGSYFGLVKKTCGPNVHLGAGEESIDDSAKKPFDWNSHL